MTILSARVYDVNTGQCFVASNPIHQHQGAVVSVDWSSSGKAYVTASLDGSIKVWDGVSSNCVTTFAQVWPLFLLASAGKAGQLTEDQLTLALALAGDQFTLQF